MRFSIEQIFLTDSEGKPLSERSPSAYHFVEASELDEAISTIVETQHAAIMGEIQRFSGARAHVIARRDRTVFALDAAPERDSG